MFLISLRLPKDTEEVLQTGTKVNTNMALRYFYNLMSQPSRAVYIIMRMDGIKYEGKEINLISGEHLNPKFKGINRFQKVPCITHGDFKLSESIAIIRYLSNKGMLSEKMYPKEVEAQARVDEFLEWHHTTLRTHCALFFRHTYIKPLITGKQPTPESIKVYTKNMETELSKVENIWLDNNDFLTGNSLNVADIFAACEIEQTRMGDYDVRIKYPKTRAWLKRVRKSCNPHYDEAHDLVYQVSATAPNAKL